jgi:glucoamylase
LFRPFNNDTDGPALRSTAIIAYANWLLENGNTTYVNDTLWPVIALDLQYVSGYWNQSTFDLWEELDSSSFFTAAVQHRMLREGVTLGNTLGFDVAEFAEQADNVLCFMQVIVFFFSSLFQDVLLAFFSPSGTRMGAI